MTLKETLVIGASPEPQRFSYKAIQALVKHGHPVIALGKQTGLAAGIQIHLQADPAWRPDTITLYIRPDLQKVYQPLFQIWKPRRIIFNPGTEHPELEKWAQSQGFIVEQACTLVLLSTGMYA